MQINDGRVSVYTSADPARSVLYTAWNNDEEIRRIIHELNFGRYAGKTDN